MMWCCRELRCLRHKIHMGLFCSVLLTDLSWLITASLQVSSVACPYLQYLYLQYLQYIYYIYNIYIYTSIPESTYPYIYFRIWSGQIILSLCSLSFVSARSLLDIFISPPSSGCFWKVNLSCLFTIVFLSALDKYICMQLSKVAEGTNQQYYSTIACHWCSKWALRNFKIRCKISSHYYL